MSVLYQRFALHRNFSANLVTFCALLRSNGVKVSLTEELAISDCLKWIDISNIREFKNTLALTLSKSAEEQTIFDELFDDYWMVLRQSKTISNSKEIHRPTRNKRISFKKKNSFLTVSDWLNKSTDNIDENREAAGYSAYNSIGETNFEEITESDFSQISKLLTKLARRVATYNSRRFINSPNGSLINLKKTVRKNIQTSDIFNLSFRKKKLKHASFTILLDVSKSMEIYSVFLLNFIYAFKTVLKRVECFVFSTKVHHLSEKVVRNDFNAFKDTLEDVFPEWSGGTRITESLNTFSQEYAPKYTNKNTVLIVLSDGWDCGNTEGLDNTMRNLRSSVKQIVWLNPLMGFKGYVPESAGIKTCLPYIDLLHSAHNANSLESAFSKVMS